MSRFAFGRRPLLASLLGPMLQARRARAASPKRLLLVCTPNGISSLRDGWSPGLKQVAADILFLDGVTMYAGEDRISNVDDHLKGPRVAFTAHVSASGKALHPSLDQFIIDKVKPATTLRSIEARVGSALYGVVNYGTNLGGIGAERDPAKVFARAFSGLMAGGDGTASREEALRALERQRARRQSVFDQVSRELGAVKSRLSTEEAKKMDGHLESLRALERRLDGELQAARATPGAGACSTKLTPPPGGASFPEPGRKHMDIMTLAFACGVTRFGTIYWDGQAGAELHKWAGASAGHHALAHTAEKKSEYDAVTRWYGDQFAYLVQKLKSFNEPDGSTLLDNTVVLWASDMTTGGHSFANGVFIVGGGRNLGVRVGRSEKLNGASQNDLYLAIAHKLDAPAARFGHPDFSRGPLSALG